MHGSHLEAEPPGQKSVVLQHEITDDRLLRDRQHLNLFRGEKRFHRGRELNLRIVSPLGLEHPPFPDRELHANATLEEDNLLLPPLLRTLFRHHAAVPLAALDSPLHGLDTSCAADESPVSYSRNSLLCQYDSHAALDRHNHLPEVSPMHEQRLDAFAYQETASQGLDPDGGLVTARPRRLRKEKLFFPVVGHLDAKPQLPP
mmetsp:Transcript_2651/g.6161  ORF Transcript_2651/g.6161 Transcript_2651/m.6161 type:complete len:202 (-) Transcript_2651:964-1569(-)